MVVRGEDAPAPAESALARQLERRGAFQVDFTSFYD